MGFKLGVLLIHGMGDQDANFADPMIEELKSFLRRLGSNDKEICFHPVWWAPVLAQREADLLRELADGNDLAWMAVRRFVVQALADAIAYQGSYRPISKDQITVYKGIHAAIAERLKQLRERLRADRPENAPEAPLVIIAHSLGCHMISKYVWDVTNPDADKKPENAFERLETLVSMVTFGCNIPLFTLAFNNLDPIQFPTPGIERFFPIETPSEHLAAVTKWLNFYDPDDVLGYPLRPLGAKYAAAVSDDIPVNVGGLLRAWNPASHTAYWTDNDVTKPVAQLLHRTLGLLG